MGIIKIMYLYITNIQMFQHLIPKNYPQPELSTGGKKVQRITHSAQVGQRRALVRLCDRHSFRSWHVSVGKAEICGLVGYILMGGGGTENKQLMQQINKLYSILEWDEPYEKKIKQFKIEQSEKVTKKVSLSNDLKDMRDLAMQISQGRSSQQEAQPVQNL